MEFSVTKANQHGRQTSTGSVDSERQRAEVFYVEAILAMRPEPAARSSSGSDGSATAQSDSWEPAAYVPLGLIAEFEAAGAAAGT